METKLLGAWKASAGEVTICALVQTDDISGLFTQLESKHYFNLHVGSYKRITGCITPSGEYDEKQLIKEQLYLIFFDGYISDWDANTIISRISTFMFD